MTRSLHPSAELVADIVSHLTLDAGLVAYAYPGHVVLPSGVDPDWYFWFGPVKGTWRGDLKNTTDGTVLRRIDSGVPSTEDDASAVALGIVNCLHDGRIAE